jgi:hypothetical protein
MELTRALITELCEFNICCIFYATAQGLFELVPHGVNEGTTVDISTAG